MNNQTNQFYNKFSVFYPLVDMFLKPQKRELFREVNQLPAGYLLDIGVGNGKHLKHYKTHKIIGIDTSSNMLKIAQKQKRRHAELFQMNGERLSFKDQMFDYIILSHVIAVVDNPDQLLAEVHRVLKPGGKIFLLNHFTPNNWLRYIDHAFGSVSKIFHFESVFYIHNLTNIKNFALLKEIDLRPFSYFKLLIYGKA